MNSCDLVTYGKILLLLQRLMSRSAFSVISNRHTVRSMMSSGIEMSELQMTQFMSTLYNSKLIIGFQTAAVGGGASPRESSTLISMNAEH